MENTTSLKTFKHYIYFWIGQLFSLLGSSVISFVIIFWITIETGSAVILSVATVLTFLPIVIFSPIAGVLADRWNRKILIFVADFFQAITTFALIIVFFLRIPNIWLVIFFTSLRSVFQAFHMPAANAIIPLMVPKDKLSRINGINYLFTGLITTIGPVIGTTLYVFLTIDQTLWIDIITFLIAIIPLFLIKIPSIHKKTEKKEKRMFLKDFKIGLNVIKSIPGLLALLIFANMVNFFIMPYNTLITYYVAIFHLGSATQLAIVMFFLQGSIFIGAVIVTIKKEWKRKIPIIVFGVSFEYIGIIIASLAPFGNFLIISIGSFIYAFMFPFVNTMIMTIFQTVIPPDKQGRVLSISVAIATAVSPIGMLISGPLAELLGIVFLFILSSILGIISIVIIWFFTSIRKLGDYQIPEQNQDNEDGRKKIEDNS
ncbi:MAG: MFS transporter [Candidatus Lokiarchaeota archaeon]|nr:MFS transporter [Candidatus Lokiarchaeota archaeon]